MVKLAEKLNCWILKEKGKEKNTQKPPPPPAYYAVLHFRTQHDKLWLVGRCVLPSSKWYVIGQRRFHTPSFSLHISYQRPVLGPILFIQTGWTACVFFSSPVTFHLQVKSSLFISVKHVCAATAVIVLSSCITVLWCCVFSFTFVFNFIIS